MGFDPASLAITAALQAASMAMNSMRRIEGPRLQDLSVTVADYGTPLNYFYGTRVLQPACFYAEEIKERKKKRKTKGGKYGEYTYYGTWAVVIADHEIAQINRMWFDKHLVLDRTGGGPDSIFNLADDYELESAMRVYLGTEDQLPDPRMQSKIEADEGEGTCPAYRGRAFIFLEDIPLEKLGNRMPQITVEAVSVPQEVYPTQVITSSEIGANAPVFSPNHSYMLAHTSAGPWELWDTVEKVQLASGTMTPLGLFEFFGFAAVDNHGRIWYVGPLDGSELRLIEPPYTFEQTVSNIYGFSGILQCFEIPDGRTVVVCCSMVGPGVSVYCADSVLNLQQYLIVGMGSCIDADGNIWVVTASGGFSGLAKVWPPFLFESHFFVAGTMEAASVVYSEASDSFFVINPTGDGATWYIVDRETFTLQASGPLVGSFYMLRNYGPAATSFWTIGSLFREYSLATGELVRSIDPLEFGKLPATGAYDHVNNGWVGEENALSNSITWWYFDRSDQAAVTLRTIVEDVAARVGLDPSDIDATDLTDEVWGYSWTQGSARDVLEPLLEIYDVDARPHNFQIQFLHRGSAAIRTLETEWLVRQTDSDTRYRHKIINDSDLPHRIFLTFADVDHDQAPNSAVARRDPEAVDSVNEVSIDLTTWAAKGEQAQQRVERVLRRRWFGRETVEARATTKELALEPADVCVLDLDGVAITARLVRNIIGADGILGQEWERDAPAIAGLSVSEGAGMPGRAPSVLFIPVESGGFVLDVPLLTDSHDALAPLMYLAAGPGVQEGFWPGAEFQRSTTGETDSFTAFASIESAQTTSWGIMESVPSADGIPHLLDESEFSVRMRFGELESVTLAELLDDQALNLAAIGSEETGWELIQFRDATLEADGTYTIQGLIRGARGTEQAMLEHEAGMAFVLLTSTAQRYTMGASDIGTSRYYVATTHGLNADEDDAVLMEYTGASRKPLAPAHVTLERDSGSGDWTITWLRRTRLGGAQVDGQDVPLGETSESYVVKIMDGSSGVMRSITSTTETATYTAAEQTADFGSTQSSLSVRVVQVAPDLSLEGFETAASA